MRRVQIFIVVLIALLMFGCFPKSNPNRVDVLEVFFERGGLCFGNNEYKRDVERYQIISVSMSRKSSQSLGFSEYVNKKFDTVDVLDLTCFSPFALDDFDLNVVYDVFMVYRDKSRVLWRFGGQFCLINADDGGMEVVDLSKAYGSYAVCSLPES